MIVTEFTRKALRVRREDRDLVPKGWEFVGERGGNLWELYRGGRTDHRIVDARVSACGKGVWVKTEPIRRVA